MGGPAVFLASPELSGYVVSLPSLDLAFAHKVDVLTNGSSRLEHSYSLMEAYS